MLNNIPIELRERAQWLVWRYEDRNSAKPTKVPYSAKNTTEKASVTDPNTWASFDEAVAAYNEHEFSGVGFVLTLNDPFALVDLDDTEGDQELYQLQINVFKRLNSYTELSPSGKGVHVLVKGTLPSGRKRNKIELYSSGRYMTVTGNMLQDCNPIIEDRDGMINELYQRFGGSVETLKYYDGNSPQEYPDDEIIAKAAAASNGAKFQKLHDGNWADAGYPSQSEADLSYINMLAFYTLNREQIARIFRSSPLGARDKRTTIRGVGYIDYMINKSFDRMLPPVDISGLSKQLEEAMMLAREKPPELNHPSVVMADDIPMPEKNERPAVPQDMPTVAGAIPVPEGLMGDIARYIYEQAPRPVPEIALAGAMALMSAICGRAFTTSNTGLNLYIMLLAASGRGKEAMAQGINHLINAVAVKCPTARDFIGPGEIMSAQALAKYMSNGPKSFVTTVSEAGLFLQSLTAQVGGKADRNAQGLQRILLDFYAKSGPNNVVHPTIYSDSAKNTTPIVSPSLTLLGESTLSEFYSSLDARMVSSGLLPRFTIIEYDGPRVPRNRNAAMAKPSTQLIERLSDLCIQATMLNTQNVPVEVGYEPDALAEIDAFDVECDARVNMTDSHDDAINQLYNRAHLKVLRLAALVAVGCNSYSPKVTLSQALWAINVVRNDVKTILDRFNSGEVGANSLEVKQINELKRMIVKYLTDPYSEVAKYGTSAAMHNERVVPYAYLQRRLVNMAAFKADRNTPTAAIRNTLRILCERGDIAECNSAELLKKFGSRGLAYAIVVPREFGF